MDEAMPGRRGYHAGEGEAGGRPEWRSLSQTSEGERAKTTGCTSEPTWEDACSRF